MAALLFWADELVVAFFRLAYLTGLVLRNPLFRPSLSLVRVAWRLT